MLCVIMEMGRDVDTICRFCRFFAFFVGESWIGMWTIAEGKGTWDGGIGLLWEGAPRAVRLAFYDRREVEIH